VCFDGFGEEINQRQQGGHVRKSVTRRGQQIKWAKARRRLMREAMAPEQGFELKMAAIQMLIPLGLAKVQEELMAEAQRLTGAPYARGKTYGAWGQNPGSVYRTDAYADGVGLLSMGIDGNRIHAGPNIWVGLAAYHYSMMSGDSQYLPLMLEIIKWVMHRIPHDTLANGAPAGIAMGSGWGPDWKHIFSTEHNMDYFAILGILLACFEQRNFKDIIKTSALRSDAVSQERDAVSAWLKEKVFDVNNCRFNIGVNEGGVDTVRALDTTTFAILGMGPSQLKVYGINPDILIHNTENCLEIPVIIDGKTVTGFDFTDTDGHGNKRPPVIWIEGTYQMVLSYREMAAFAESQKDGTVAAQWNQKADALIMETERLIELLGADCQIPPYTSAKPRPTEVLTTFKEDWEIQRADKNATVKSVASATWRLFAIENFNPMSYRGIVTGQPRAL
jgi:hypothetical protein